MKSHNHSSVTNYRRGERGALVSMLTNALLFVLKLFAGIFGRSHAMVADALHTCSDLATTLIVFVGFRIGRQPPDPHHPYGHGKAEPIATKLVAIILIAFGFWIGLNALTALFKRELFVPHSIALWAALVSIFTKEALFHYTYRLGKKIGSTSLTADAWHHRSDALSSCAALVGIAGARMGFPFLDPIAGIIVAAVVIKVGFNFFHRAYDELMDAALGERVMSKIRTQVFKVEGVKLLANLKARKMGMEIFVDMTIKVAKNKSVEEGHTIAENVKDSILVHISNVKDVLVHIEPYKK